MSRVDCARLRAFIFDLDGTLVDSFGDIAATCNYVRDSFGKPPLSLETIRTFIGRGVRKLLEDVLETTDPAIIETALTRHAQHYGAHLLDTTVLFDDARALLTKLDGKLLGVLSNKGVAASQKILDGLEIAASFKQVVGGDNPLGRKPDPRALLQMLEALGVAPQQACMVGDSVIDAQTGHNAGVVTVIVEREPFSASERREMPAGTIVVQDLREAF